MFVEAFLYMEPMLQPSATVMPVSNAVPWLWEASMPVLLAPICRGIVARYATGGV